MNGFNPVETRLWTEIGADSRKDPHSPRRLIYIHALNYTCDESYLYTGCPQRSQCGPLHIDLGGLA